MSRGEDRHTRERILETADALFMERGYPGTSVQQIAKRVGITPAALYWYFESKEAIFATVLEDAHVAFLDRMESAATASEPTARLYQTVYAHVLSQLEGGGPRSSTTTTFTIAQLVRSLPARSAERIRGLQIRYLQFVESILDAGAASGAFTVDHVTTTAFAVINLAEYVITWFQPDGPLSVPEAADLHGVLALRMAGATVLAEKERRQLAIPLSPVTPA
jgi:AcrR family transcriptional regulator